MLEPFICLHLTPFQVKPLTEEEKKQKLAELREKMAAKRAVKAKEEAKEQKANEAIRRKSGKVRIIDIIFVYLHLFI